MEQQTIIQNQFFFFIADEGNNFYSFSTKAQNERMEKEETKAKFLVDLLEKYGYETKDILLDFEGPKYEILGSVDLVAFKNEKPFLIAQFLRNKPSLTEISLSREALYEKMKDLKPQYGVLSWANKKETFLFSNGKITRCSVIS
ncbi:MAG: hypothetical protein Q7R99_02830 [bacterium]|nr:hypothetical protein [bacterium]